MSGLWESKPKFPTRELSFNLNRIAMNSRWLSMTIRRLCRSRARLKSRVHMFVARIKITFSAPTTKRNLCNLNGDKAELLFSGQWRMFLFLTRNHLENFSHLNKVDRAARDEVWTVAWTEPVYRHCDRHHFCLNITCVDNSRRKPPTASDKTTK